MIQEQLYFLLKVGITSVIHIDYTFKIFHISLVQVFVHHFN